MISGGFRGTAAIRREAVELVPVAAVAQLQNLTGSSQSEAVPGSGFSLAWQRVQRLPPRQLCNEVRERLDFAVGAGVLQRLSYSAAAAEKGEVGRGRIEAESTGRRRTALQREGDIERVRRDVRKALRDEFAQSPWYPALGGEQVFAVTREHDRLFPASPTPRPGAE